MTLQKFEIGMTLCWQYEVEITDQELVNHALEGYQLMMDSKATLENMLEHVVHSIAKFHRQDVEGVGHVTISGRRSRSAQFENCGINLVPRYEDCAEFEVRQLDAAA